MEKEQLSISKILKPNGRMYGFRFTDESLYPFVGPHFGKRLALLKVEYWYQFVKENPIDTTNLTAWHEICNSYQNTLGKLVSYAKKRIKQHETKPRNYWTKGRKWINNGEINKLWHPELELPEGFVFGRISWGKIGQQSIEHKKKISESVTLYYTTKQGKQAKRNLRKLRKTEVKMKKHTKLYLQEMGYDKSDFMPCEITGLRAVDIHHIDCKGMGGSKDKDYIENLMAATREVHLIYGDKKQYMEWLVTVHLTFMMTKVPWIETNPHDEMLDVLLKNETYKKLLEWKRR